jgi:pantoate--beta-alanine ligase
MNDEPIELSRQQAFNNLSNLFQVEYLEVLDANNLKQITTNTKEIIIISAIRLAETRLIDNIVFRRSNV